MSNSYEYRDGALLMKSLVLTAPNTIGLQHRSVPSPGAGEVLLRVAYAAICHTDIYTISGGYADAKYPTVPGHEFSAVVERCGELVSHVKAGDRVTSMGFVYCGVCSTCRNGWHGNCQNLRAMPRDIEGTFQEYVTMPAGAVFKLPNSVSLEEGALVEPTACAYNAVELAAIRPGEHVAIVGVGPIGLLALQCASLFDPASLIAVGNRNRNRLELAEKLGATHTLMASETDTYAAIQVITCVRGADAVIFCGGDQQTWDLSGRSLAIRGRFVVEAMPPTADAMWSVPVTDFTQKAISYLGASGFTGAQFGSVLELIRAKQVDVQSLITHRFRLEDYKEALELAGKRRDVAIKVLFDLASTEKAKE